MRARHVLHRADPVQLFRTVHARVLVAVYPAFCLLLLYHAVVARCHYWCLRPWADPPGEAQWLRRALRSNFVWEARRIQLSAPQRSAHTMLLGRQRLATSCLSGMHCACTPLAPLPLLPRQCSKAR